MTIAQTNFLCAIVIFVAACGSYAGTKSTALLPEVFTPPDGAPDFSLPQELHLIERRILSSKCGSASSNMSSLSLMSGLTTRPESAGELYLDVGRTPNGTKWFLVRAQDDPETTYCGIALAGGEKETNVSVVNVRSRDMATIKASVESGDFLCACKQLSGKR